MRRRFIGLFFWLLCCGCGNNLALKQLDEPCTRTAQCTTGLVCLAGVCQLSTDAGVDAGSDGG